MVMLKIMFFFFESKYFFYIIIDDYLKKNIIFFLDGKREFNDKEIRKLFLIEKYGESM